MLSFQQFIIETIRSKERAANLVDKIVSRQGSSIAMKQKNEKDVPRYEWNDYESKLRYVPISKIKTIQSYVKRKDLKYQIHASNHDPIKLVKVGNDYMVHDGNHRLMAHKLLGLKKIKAHVHQGWLDE
tara:strand:- start:1180 stop:1563 length:384 start_codon:yes stop_codon:yes gene_type:complete